MWFVLLDRATICVRVISLPFFSERVFVRYKIGTYESLLPKRNFCLGKLSL